MKILAIEASTEALSAALFDSAQPDGTAEVFEIAPRAHAQRLLPAAQQLLDQAGLGLADLDGLAFARGPGAFTGLRIAAGLVQGLAAGAGLPVVGISTLAVVAARALDQIPEAGRVQVVQDARMGEIYTATFARADLPVSDDVERVMAPADLEVATGSDTIRAGNGWALVVESQALAEQTVYVEAPHAADVARLAWPMLRDGQGRPAAEALPVYVRDDVARKPGGSR
ncbi:tRNA (adenosine(37)-N6)-threonylcarbamoyltransferase complex dimerization subunit type 1 TsaB [Salinisphaera sp. SPP-AMP-43]|uniref:tRNA (adenosine(37)-N6)-threonylcarbamoyltransferase complex dimerization subunit type 1 TsaB n=1 Tax=Salinisphaera sp. SPP-AMP-43 TaxID=3121288 RepID=UPI003C6E0160